MCLYLVFLTPLPLAVLDKTSTVAAKSSFDEQVEHHNKKLNL